MFNNKLLPSDFVGRGKMVYGDFTVPIIVHGTYNSYEPSTVSCTIAPDGRRKSLGSFSNSEDIEINAKSNEGEDIRILGLTQITSTYAHSKTTWKGNATHLIKGQLKSFNSSNSTIECSVFIPYTPLASANVSYIRSYDGTITIDEEKKREGITFETPLGQATLIDNYEYAEDLIGIDKATIRIRRCQIHLTIKRKGKYSLEKLLRSISEVFDETLWLLSFLSRKRLVWYRTEAIAFLKKEGVSDYLHATSHRQSWLGFQDKQNDNDRWVDLLIKIDKLRSGLFEILHKNFKASEHKKLIMRTIPYLLMSQEQGYFESRIANTYSALETMVAGLSPDEDKEVGTTLPSKDFKNLTRKLRSTIREEIGDENIQEKIFNKLGELNRRSILDRLIKLIERYKIPIEKLWRPGTDIKSELQKIIKRRNLYIHQGRIEDFYQYSDDSYRLQTLVELWILRLLECPDDAINDRAFHWFSRR